MNAAQAGELMVSSVERLIENQWDKTATDNLLVAFNAAKECGVNGIETSYNYIIEGLTFNKFGMARKSAYCFRSKCND